METDSWRSGAPHFKSVLSAGSLSPKIKIRWSLRYNYTLTPSISLTPVALLLLLSGPQLINTLVSFVTSRLQAINFHLVLNQGYQPSDAYGSFPFGPQPRISTVRCLRPFPFQSSTKDINHQMPTALSMWSSTKDINHQMPTALSLSEAPEWTRPAAIALFPR